MNKKKQISSQNYSIGVLNQSLIICLIKSRIKKINKKQINKFNKMQSCLRDKEWMKKDRLYKLKDKRYLDKSYNKNI